VKALKKATPGEKVRIAVESGGLPSSTARSGERKRKTPICEIGLALISDNVGQPLQP
jgi:hypothetical protein